MSSIKRILEDVMETFDKLTDDGYGAAYIAIPMAAEIHGITFREAQTIYRDYWIPENEL